MAGLDRYAKAITAAGTVGYGIFQVITTASSAAGEGITSGEWVRLAVFTVLAGLAVWAVPNKQDPAKPAVVDVGVRLAPGSSLMKRDPGPDGTVAPLAPGGVVWPQSERAQRLDQAGAASLPPPAAYLPPPPPPSSDWGEHPGRISRPSH